MGNGLGLGLARRDKTMIDRETRRKLPKAALLVIEWSKWDAPKTWGPQPWFSVNRLANCLRLRLGKLVLYTRAPWQERPARQLYPHLFREEGQ